MLSSYVQFLQDYSDNKLTLWLISFVFISIFYILFQQFASTNFNEFVDLCSQPLRYFSKIQMIKST